MLTVSAAAGKRGWSPCMRCSCWWTASCPFLHRALISRYCYGILIVRGCCPVAIWLVTETLHCYLRAGRPRWSSCRRCSRLWTSSCPSLLWASASQKTPSRQCVSIHKSVLLRCIWFWQSHCEFVAATLLLEQVRARQLILVLLTSDLAPYVLRKLDTDASWLLHQHERH
jgi:hypothetical protein